MNKKGSMELSVNAIVILVIAIVMLGLILGFVKSKFSDLDNSLVSEEPEPAKASLSDPVTLSRSSIVTGNGKSVAMKVSMYNGGTDPAEDVTPSISCNEEGVVSGTFNAKTVQVGEAVTYAGLLEVGSAGKGKYLCSVTGIEGSATDFTIEIK